jgi:hypothetical protein
MRLFSSPDVPLVNIAHGRISGVPFFDAEMGVRYITGVRALVVFTFRRGFHDGMGRCDPTTSQLRSVNPFRISLQPEG